MVRGGPIKGEMPLQAWADGYRLNLAWIIDVYGWALQANALTPEGGIRGLLLVDELEQHTHPSIQLGFIARLKALWPELQVIGTTHSPMIVLGAQADEIVVLKRVEGRVVTAPAAASFAGYSAEDVLEDERLFDTPSSRPRRRRFFVLRAADSDPAGFAKRRAKELPTADRAIVEVEATAGGDRITAPARDPGASREV